MIALKRRGRNPHVHEIVGEDAGRLVARCGVTLDPARCDTWDNHLDYLVELLAVPWFAEDGQRTPDRCGHCDARRPPVIADVVPAPAYL